MFFYRKLDREKLKKARDEGYKDGVADTTKKYKKIISRDKRYYNVRLDKKSAEIRKLDKKVRDIEIKSQHLQEVEKVLLLAYIRATNEKHVEKLDAVDDFRRIASIKDDIEIKQSMRKIKEVPLKKSIEKFKQERLKLAK